VALSRENECNPRSTIPQLNFQVRFVEIGAQSA
jgi:hypothetical protein